MFTKVIFNKSPSSSVLRLAQIATRNMHHNEKAYINGQWVAANSGKSLDVVNPVNGNIIGTVPDMSVSDTQKAIDSAYTAFQSWKDTTAKERSQILRKWYNLMTESQNEIAEILTAESGKPIMEANGEVGYGNSFVEWFSELSRQIRGDIINSPIPSKKILVDHHPIGVVSLITPWNFPHAMIARKASAALSVGCTVVIRPAEDTPLTAIEMVKCAEKAGFPPGVINLVTSGRENAPVIGKILCEHPLMAGLSFTGSTAVGKILYNQCSQGVKRLGLELGGNAPFIVFNSANIDKAVEGALTSKFRNCGQTCVSANRFLIQEEVLDEFITKLEAKVKNLKMGDGSRAGIQLGPLINEAQFHKITDFVNDAVSKGAKVISGGKSAPHLGKLFFEPTILTDIKENMKVYTEEVFGPIMSLITFKTEKEALHIANKVDVGLAGYFYSEDVSQIFRVSKNMEVGMVGVNEGLISCAEAPFGGVKQSGIGREGSHLGTEDYTYIKIQQVDGGFFEKFGSLFREQAEMAATMEQVEKERVAEEAAQIAPKEEDEDEEPSTPPSTAESDDSITINSFTESDQERDRAEVISAAFNIDELYTEILYVILHNVGCDVSYEVGQTALFSYAQEAFKVQNDKHRHLLEIAENKEDPELMINVEVIEAKELRAKDSNGLSDPFVTLYLASNTSHRYNTSVKSMTLNPVWEEHFALPITDKSIDDTLCLEVWDFDAAESVKEKMGKIFEVKGVKGIRKLVKEIAVTATTGQHDNELIGRAKIPLSTIPASGMTMWYTLDKKNKVVRQGVLKVRVSFSSGKNNQVAEQEHRHMRRIILLHELELSQVTPHWWCGNFSAQGEQLLTQHIAQSGLSQTEVALCSYSVYAGVHQNHALSFSLFSKLLEKLLKPLQTEMISEEDMKLFWEATKKLLPSCFGVIRKIRKKTCNEKTVMKQVIEVLKILKNIAALGPKDIDLFPANLYPWITYHVDEPNCDICGTLNDAVSQGANDWLNYILENNIKSGDSGIARLQNLIQIIQLVRSDLQKAIEYYDKLFIEHVNFQYARCLYVFYQAKVATLCEPEVLDICKNLKGLHYDGYSFRNGAANDDPSEDPLLEGTSLFELYLAIQRFVTLGQGLCPADYTSFHIKNFHEWFHGGVLQWLDIAVYKALQRIEKAVELDELVHVDGTTKCSSSAVDTLTIFYQVKVFWQQLNWPDVESCYTFIAKIIDDICRCCIFYADKMSCRVDGLGDIKNVYEKTFEVTNEWCLAINNIEYVRETLEPFTRDLGMDSIIKKISDLKSPLEAQRCQDTLNNVISNAIDTVRNKIIELLETVVNKMAPSMKRLLIEGAELGDQDSNSIDKLMRYVDNNLATLHRELNEENFNRTLAIVWDMLSETLNELIQSSLEKRRPPSFFANLRKTLNLMLGSFKDPNDDSNCDSLKRTEEILRINGLETADLIHEVHLELANKFDQLNDSPYGEITVRCKFEENVLKIEIINARDLAVMDSNGTCDSFVRVHLLPEHKFNNVDKPKTKTHNKTLFPLYDETFTINLSPEQRAIENGLILLSVKDKDMLGYNNQYVGEAFMKFKDIPNTSESLSNLPQVKKWLSRPTSLETDALKALETRQGDKQAKEFLRKFKQRLVS